MQNTNKKSKKTSLRKMCLQKKFFPQKNCQRLFKLVGAAELPVILALFKRTRRTLRSNLFLKRLFLINHR